jgi:hypothetical protein
MSPASIRFIKIRVRIVGVSMVIPASPRRWCSRFSRQTCKLAGFSAVAEIDGDLLEWNYGEYEGRRTSEIRAERPNWQLFRDGCPGGSRRSRSLRGLTVLYAACALCREAYCFFPADISSACSPFVGSVSY